MKRNGFTWVEALIVVAILLIIAAILFPLFQHPHRGYGSRDQCRANLKYIALAVAQYVQDYDGRQPELNGLLPMPKEGWAQKLKPYGINHQNGINYQIFSCPADTALQNPAVTSANFYSYYFNRNVAGKALKQIRWPQSTILLGEGEASSSDYNCASFALCYADGTVKSVPYAAKTRHLEGANYAFVDGHVKWLKPNRIQSRRISDRTYGFPIK